MNSFDAERERERKVGHLESLTAVLTWRLLNDKK